MRASDDDARAQACFQKVVSLAILSLISAARHSPRAIVSKLNDVAADMQMADDDFMILATAPCQDIYG